MGVASGLNTKVLLLVLFQKYGAKVKEIDPVASHASGMENLPWTRLAGVVFLPKRKSTVDVAKLHSMSPERVREYIRDGDFASYYERPDEEMLALWRTGLEETRNIIMNDWA